jgi:hypothetical protein
VTKIKLDELIDPLVEDFKVILREGKRHNPNLVLSEDSLPMSVMWQALNVVSGNRAYGDNHPKWVVNKRLLPYDGREYCFYYTDGTVTDVHVDSLLKAVRTILIEKGIQ